MVKIVPKFLLPYAVVFIIIVATVFSDSRLREIDFEEPIMIWRQLGLVMGIAGSIFYSITFLLSQRQTVVEKSLGSLPTALRLHHRLGIAAFVCLVLHPIFLIIPTSETLLEAFNTIFSLSSIDNLTGIIALLATLVFISCAFLSRLPYHIWRRIHLLAGLAFVPSIIHFVVANWPTERYLPTLILAAIAVLAILLYLRQLWNRRLSAKKHLIGTIDAVRKLDERTVEIAIGSQTIESFDHHPGQFAYLSVLNGGNRGILPEWHPFSISSAPRSSQLIFCIRACGDYTRKLQLLQKNDQVAIEGPFGNFLPQTQKPLLNNASQTIWIAGGIGITPFLSKVRANEVPPNTILFYCVRSKKEAHFLDEMAHKENLTVHLHESDTMGMPTFEALEAMHHKMLDRKAMVFMCGPTTLQNLMRKSFTRSGFAQKRIISEDFSLR